MATVDQALEVAAGDGLAIFPCGKDKAPLVATGFRAATRDPEQIAAWWAEFPDALIGAAIPEGMLVIDVDPRNGGDDTVRALVADGIPFPATRIVKTGGKGWHRWYTVDPAVEFRSLAGPGVDVKRHDRGYVIMPPSESDAGPYTWYAARKAVPLPAETVEYLRKPPVDERVASAAIELTNRPEWLRATRYADAALANAVRAIAGAGAGERNNVLNSSAFGVLQLVHGGELDEDYALETLAHEAESIGLPHREVMGTLRSAYEAAAKDPRVAPPYEGTAPETEVDPEAEARFWTNWEVDEPAPPFYLWPILPKNAYVLVYGATEAAKSMVWNALLAAGSHHGIKSSVYSLENPAHVDRQRLRRMAPDPANFRISHAGINLGDHAQLEALVKREQENATDVVLIDTYSHAFTSRSDDGNAKAIEFARMVRYIMAQVGCSVVVVDHTGYVNKTEPRDASAKRQAVDVAILMEREGSWQGRGQPARFKLTNNKSARFGNPFENMRGMITDTREGGLVLEWESSELGEWQA